MRSETQLGFEGWFAQHAAVLTALGLWTAGLALGGASVWRVHEASAATDESSEASSGDEAAPGETSAGSADREDTIFMPMDVIVGRNTAAPVAALTQKP